jgi:Na+/proline symporter
MHIIDWSIVVVYFIINILIGLYYYKKASGNTENFFLSGRKMTWWLAGLSMVATTFAADTPLAVTELVGQNGIAGNWLRRNAYCFLLCQNVETGKYSY